jgi:hypothetical protein
MPEEEKEQEQERVTAVLGRLLIDVLRMLQKADDDHIHARSKFKNWAYHAGYTDAVMEIADKIKNYSEGDK